MLKSNQTTSRNINVLRFRGQFHCFVGRDDKWWMMVNLLATEMRTESYKKSWRAWSCCSCYWAHTMSGGALPINVVLGMYRWMGLHFHDSTDYGVAFSSILNKVTRLGSHFFGTLRVREWFVQDWLKVALNSFKIPIFNIQSQLDSKVKEEYLVQVCRALTIKQI